MRKFFLLILVASLSFTSCQKLIDSADAAFSEDVTKEDLEEYKVKGLYAISIPDYMKELKYLNDDASFQYANTLKENYIIVIDESKQEFIDAIIEAEMYDSIKTPLENYTDIQLSSFTESINGLNVTELKSNIKSLDSKQYQFIGNVDDLDIAYVVSFIEGPENMYMIMSWTLKERYEKYKNTILLTQSTFKTL